MLQKSVSSVRVEIFLLFINVSQVLEQYLEHRCSINIYSVNESVEC